MPVFQRYLQQLSSILHKTEQYLSANAISEQSIMEAKLTPTMLPFHVQVEIAANFVLRACYPLANRAVPPYGEFPNTFAGLLARLVRASDLLRQLHPSEFEGQEESVIFGEAGNAKLALQSTEFLTQYALPNFFFHLTTAYALLRQAGVPLGKSDFDGYHLY